MMELETETLFSHALYWYIRFDSGENLVGSTVRFRGKLGSGR
jgi:hypothetical protein